MIGWLARRVVDSGLYPVARRLRHRLGETSITGAMQRLAIEQSASYAMEHMKSAVLFQDLEVFRTHVFRRKPPGGLNLEFGVHKGRGVNLFGSLTEELIYGFDSFEGLYEDWSGSMGATKGYFDQKGLLPKVRSNVRLLKGWFSDTLPPFLLENKENISFANIDCDTFESSSYVLSTLNPRIVKGAVLIFDEYFGYPGWEVGEHKAWREFCAATAIAFNYIAICDGRVAVEVTGRD